MNEPQGSPTWFPVNDSPKDFATYDFAVTVPGGEDRDGQRRARLDDRQRGHDDLALARGLSRWCPISTTATNGVFELTPRGANGLPEYNAVDPQTRRFGQKNPEPAARLVAA